MALSVEQVRKVAHLSQLTFSDDELPALGSELSRIVDFVEQLAAVDVSGVSPVAQVSGLVNVTRADVAAPGLSVDEALAGAPLANGEAFLVPKAVTR